MCNSSPGIYNVTYQSSCDKSVSHEITINPNPTIDCTDYNINMQNCSDLERTLSAFAPLTDTTNLTASINGTAVNINTPYTFSKGANTVIWSLTTLCNNTITCEQTITFNLNDDDGDCITNAIDEDDDNDGILDVDDLCYFGALEFEGLQDWGGHGLGLYRDNAADILPWGNYEEIGIGSAIPGQQTSNAVPPSSVAWPQPFAMSTALRFDGFGSSNKQFLLGKVTNKTNVQVVFLSIEKDENGNANLIFNWGKNYNYNRFLIQKNVSVGQWIGVYVDFNGEIFNATNATPINLSRAIRFKLVNPNTK